MRHGKKFNHLSRTASHRRALLSNLASSLILHKRIRTTVAKAKALRRYVEPLVTMSRQDTTHSRRVVFSYLENKESIRELFEHIADKVANRPGGYTRIIRLAGRRLGDDAELCMMEFVDYNKHYLEEKEKPSKRVRRGGKGRAKGLEAKEDAQGAAEQASASVSEEASSSGGSTEQTSVSVSEEASSAGEADEKAAEQTSASISEEASSAGEATEKAGEKTDENADEKTDEKTDENASTSPKA